MMMVQRDHPFADLIREQHLSTVHASDEASWIELLCLKCGKVSFYVSPSRPLLRNLIPNPRKGRRP